VPKADLRAALGAQIPFFVKLLDGYTTEPKQTVGSLLEKMTEYGEWHPNTSDALLMQLKTDFVMH